MDVRTLFFVGLIVSATGVLSPPLALSAGLAFGLTCAHPFPADGRRLARFLLQASVVALGFGMNLNDVLRAGRSGFLYTAGGIAFALVAGLTVGRMLRVRRHASFLITAGTAICGGSAIAAIAPILDADEQDVAVSMATVFVLNSIALLAFPTIGAWLHLSQAQFGLWSALAIHDTSSVVGAAAKYGSVALVVGTTVKLARALWIVPLSIGTALARRSGATIAWPWFILWFSVAAFANTYLPALSAWTHVGSQLGRLGLTATLYLIGTGLSRPVLARVGIRPLLQGVILWLVVATTSAWLIVVGAIAMR